MREIATTITISKEGDNPFFGDSVIQISIVDEGGGHFYEISNPDGEKLRIEYEEIVEVIRIIKRMERDMR